MLLKKIEPIIRKKANLGDWLIISRGVKNQILGKMIFVKKLHEVQFTKYTEDFLEAPASQAQASAGQGKNLSTFLRALGTHHKSKGRCAPRRCIFGSNTGIHQDRRWHGSAL